MKLTSAGTCGHFTTSRQEMNSTFEKVGTKDDIRTLLVCKYTQLKRVEGEKNGGLNNKKKRMLEIRNSDE
jgi:hypothetical protein